MKTDPTAGIKNPARPKTGGFPAWTEDDLERYEAYWPIGTKERVWLAVLLYTGLRRGDAAQLWRQHCRDGVPTIRTEKTGVTVTILILPALSEILRAGPLAFICGENGGAGHKGILWQRVSRRLQCRRHKESATWHMQDRRDKASRQRRQRRGAGSHLRLAGLGMVSLYTRAADRISKLDRTPSEQSIPAPLGKVRGGRTRT